MKVARLFSGFDGAGEGIRAAGFDLSWAIEYDPKIAAVAEMNGHNVIVANILDVDPRSLERPDIIHASPCCTNASMANPSGNEALSDIYTAMKTMQFVDVLRPQVFTLENVWGYRLFQSFAGGDKCEGILPALKRMGYKVAYWHLNAADWGVAQTRKRLILVAALDFYPERPQETHYNPKYPELAHPSLFAQARLPWVGWYEAIENLIPTLPDSQFAPWQLARINSLLFDMRKSFLVNGALSGGDEKTLQIHSYDEPTGTIVSTINSVKDTRAWLSSGRVVKMTPRALARFQSFQDSYKLSGNNVLDCKGIGNACPPKLFEAIYRQIKMQMESMK